MTPSRTTTLASALVLAVGTLWGLYWLPVRGMEASGLAGAWGTAAITLCGVAALSPFAWRDRVGLRQAAPVALAGVALGGVGFALYSVGFVFGRVAVVILLFFLSPVWSTLIARAVYGVPVSGRRFAALGLGLAGLVAVLAAEGQMPVPRAAGEWLGLASGLLWSIGTTMIRARPALPMAGSACVFACGAAVASTLLALLFAPLPELPGAAAAGLALGTGALWWGASMVGLMWAAARLEPARVGILLMAEVIVGTVSAAILAGEALGPVELLGGALVIAAGVVELLPRRA